MSNSSQENTFGARLSRALREANMSQAQLARSVDVSAKTIERYASRDRPPSLQREDVRETILAVSNQLDIREEWLTEGEGEMKAGARASGSGRGPHDEIWSNPLREARLSAGLSRPEAAAYLQERGVDVSIQDISDFESGDADSVGPGRYGTAIYLLARRAERPPQSGEEPMGGKDISADVRVVPELQAGGLEETPRASRRGEFLLSKTYIRQQYGVDPSTTVVMRVRGDGMIGTLHPGQMVLAVQWDRGRELEDGAVYGLKGPHGFSVRRLRFGREEERPVIWVWADNEEYEDQRRSLTPEEFNQEYQVLAIALGVEQKL